MAGTIHPLSYRETNFLSYANIFIYPSMHYGCHAKPLKHSNLPRNVHGMEEDGVLHFPLAAVMYM